MHFSFKFRQLLTLSVLTDVLHHPHIRFKCRRKGRYWSKHGITIYKLYFWHKGLWSSYYAVFDEFDGRVMFQNSVVDYCVNFDGLEHGLDFILSKYDDFHAYLEDMYYHDFSLDDIPDFDMDDIPDDENVDIPF